ncbi:tyrosine aminotransferase-like [Haliotis cracherodii]|uniref:tyrosine aminotransferase-like n=1 Tax=Haliotis cracherodii TaxID=6455 RepID=UPI0039E99AE7
MDPKTKKAKTCWNVPASTIAEQTFNPIRNIVDSMKLTPNPEKEMIALSIGDPTVFGNLPDPEVAEEAVIAAVRARKSNGYGPSVGCKMAREAVAKHISTPSATVTAQDVILCSGCSSALDLCITCLANPGQNILIPRPGFSIYKTLAESLGISILMYDLIPEKSWEADLGHMEELIDVNTAAIIVTNPSNPCGSVYSQRHLEDILALAEKYKLPIIADEIYEHFVFPGLKYHPIASLTKDVPVLSCGGLTKRYLVPGWRLGWIIINDRHDVLTQVKSGLVRLSQRILGPNSLIQAAVPDILEKTPASFYLETLNYIKRNADVFYERLSAVPGLVPVMPQGAMYMMVGYDKDLFPEFKTDIDFTQSLVTEQSVFCLPSTCFQYSNYFRIVLTVPTEKVTEACDRIQEFCSNHYTDVLNGVNGHQH